jgi:DNA-binding Xre family transcriptional regulator
MVIVDTEISERKVDVKKGTILLKVPQLLKERNLNAVDLMYGAHLAPATAYRIADGKADAIRFETLTSLCDYFGVGVSDILEFVPDESKATEGK